jgi:hypothetical protein
MADIANNPIDVLTQGTGLTKTSHVRNIFVGG